jgi:tRNA G18 (ribose-2'-O)-methylase SpoU
MPVPLLGTGSGMSGAEGAASHAEAATIDVEAPVTVCLGAEREGLPPEVLDACERQLTIPLRPGAESLNVAATAAIVLQGISSPAPEERGSNG